jgi:Arc/MetJ family transcription regulator
MRTTLNLPDSLITEAIKLTNLKTKTDVIVYALKTLIQQEKIKKIKKFKGKIKLDIDLDALRQR